MVYNNLIIKKIGNNYKVFDMDGKFLGGFSFHDKSTSIVDYPYLHIYFRKNTEYTIFDAITFFKMCAFEDRTPEEIGLKLAIKELGKISKLIENMGDEINIETMRVMMEVIGEYGEFIKSVLSNHV